MKALALFSGGLDSMLAISLVAKQGVEVEALYFNTGFTGSNYSLLERRAAMAGASFRPIDISNEYLQEVLLNPIYGYGKAMNPCIDCHGFMFKSANLMLKELNADFLISGEVLGQRPMSQRSQALNSVAKLSGAEQDIITRPLSAKLLKPSKAELNGWLNRDELLDISGRGRTRQMALAKEFGYSDYESPAGGCILTLQAFAAKLRDLKKYGELNAQNASLLKIGRHLRLGDGAKMIISRNESEGNLLLEKLEKGEASDFAMIKTHKIGAISLLCKNASENDLTLACKLALAYTKDGGSGECEFLDKKISESACEKSLAQEFFVKE